MTLGKLGPDVSLSGNKGKLPIEDDNTMTLLNGILKQLRMLNMHMEILTDSHFTNEDT